MSFPHCVFPGFQGDDSIKKQELIISLYFRKINGGYDVYFGRRLNCKENCKIPRGLDRHAEARKCIAPSTCLATTFPFARHRK